MVAWQALLGPVVILVGVGVGVHYGSAAQETRLERHNLGVSRAPGFVFWVR